MKRFKKLLSTLLVCIMILGSVSAFAAEDISVLKGMGIAPDSFSEAVGDEAITRGEYAYMMANLLNKDDMDPMDTRFTDVTKADYMSGHIEYLATRGVAGGYGDGTFGKDDPMKLETAYVFLIRLLGLESFVRVNEASQSNFTTFAYSIGLKSGNYTNAQGYVTKKGAAAIVHDALTASLPRAEWSTEGGELILNNDKDSGSNILSENLGISSYDAYVKDIDMEDYTVTFEITKNNYKNNPVVIPEGTEKTFIAASSVNIYEYDRTPVSIWVDEDEKIIDIQYKKDVEIRYVNIVSVNGDEAEHTYRVGSIKRMTFLDDEEEYEVAESGATYKLNGKNFTGQTALAGNYAKVVLVRDEITHVESWDLTEGGIIDEISNEKVTFTQGDKNNTIRDLDKFKTQLFFVGGRNASLSEIKPNSVFYYYKNEADSYIAFVVSEVIITDVLGGVGTDEITIGNNILNYQDKFYFKTIGTTFKSSAVSLDFVDIYNRTVSAYVTHNGNVLYVVPEDVSDIKGSFYGVVVGVEPDRWEPELADIKLFALNGSEVTEKDYKITEKTRYKDNLTLDDLRTHARDKYGSGIFRFKATEEGVILSVEAPERYFNFPSPQEGGKIVSTQFFNLGGKIYLNIGNPTGVAYINPGAIYSINEFGGNFIVESLEITDVRGKTPPSGGLKVILIGDGTALQPSMMFLTSKDGTDNLGAFGKGSVRYGVITSKTSVNDDGITKTKLIIEGTNGIESYLVMPSTAASYGEDTMIKYTVAADYADDQILITGSADLSGEIDTWNLSGIMTSVATGTVKNASVDGIVLDNNTPYFYRPSENTIFSIDLTGDVPKYGKGASTDVSIGDKVFFYASEGIRFMVNVKY